MADDANLSVPELADETRSSWHQVTWGVTRASLLQRGERRMEAETYLSDGYGRRIAIESRPTGWSTIDKLATVWQPSRLKGITVTAEHGVPFLSAGQVFERRPTARKWLSLQRTPDAAERFVASGLLLLSCSGTVGLATLAYRPHLGHLITHDLLRVAPLIEGARGWLYSYMRTASFRAMATGAHYGHMIKHLEPSHVAALPIIQIDDARRAQFDIGVTRVLESRNRADELIEQANAMYAEAVDVDVDSIDLEAPFVVRASDLGSGRRRLDGYHHNAIVQKIYDGLHSSAESVQMLPDVTKRIWWPGRFSRVFGENGTPYVSAVELFDQNPPITKQIHAGLVANAEDYFIEPGWLVMARSGQIYGLNGRAFLASKQHTKFFVSEDLIRIVPDRESIRPGYLLTAIGHPALGRPLVLRHAYGTSIPHLEPEDLRQVPVPRFAPEVENQIADRVEEAARLSSEADELEDELTRRAEDLIELFLHNDI